MKFEAGNRVWWVDTRHIGPLVASSRKRGSVVLVDDSAVHVACDDGGVRSFGLQIAEEELRHER